jgi:hypothetical protein
VGLLLFEVRVTELASNDNRHYYSFPAGSAIAASCRKSLIAATFVVGLEWGIGAMGSEVVARLRSRRLDESLFFWYN